MGWLRLYDVAGYLLVGDNIMRGILALMMLVAIAASSARGKTSLPVDDAASPPMKRIPLGTAFADDAVNTSIFRVNSVISAGNYQFAAYYAADASVVVARRDLGSVKWDIATQPFKGNVADAHNDVVLGISADGLVHVSYDHHGNPLHYRVSGKPFDIHSFGDTQPMTGRDEEHVTYPQFISAPDGRLYFFYRDGASGNGTLCLNRYNVESKSWTAVQHPLVDGEGKCNPYWWRPSIATDGAIHLAWCWRDTPNAETNHDLCYSFSKDGGRTWLRSDGEPQQLPITRENAEVIDAIHKGSNLINQCSSAVDAQGHCHLAQYFNDTGGVPQYFHEWFDGRAWHKNQVTHRTVPFLLSGGGSLAIPISRPEIAIKHDGIVCLITRDAEAGGGIRLYEATMPYEKWWPIDVSHDDLGYWEPTYDRARLTDAGILSLFILPVQQGNHERMTKFGAHVAEIMEIDLN
jgi:hypothetical protein